jgi:hypothetical protein
VALNSIQRKVSHSPACLACFGLWKREFISVLHLVCITSAASIPFSI